MTMNARRKRLGIVLVILTVGAVVVAWRYGMRIAWFTQNDVTTSVSKAYPELVSRTYAQPVDDVYHQLQAVAADIPRWRVVRTDASARRIEVEVRTAVGGFTDDLTATVEPDGTGARVVIRSRSRVGRGDLGENARHIQALQRRMDAAL